VEPARTEERIHPDMTRVRTWSLVLVTAAGLGLAACSSSSSSPTTTAPAAPTTSAAPTSSIATISDPSAPGTIGTEPTITVPPGAPPTQLESKDLIVGTGPAAKAGDTVSVQYVGVAYSSGKVFDSSWSRGQPFQFTLGEGQVIHGWDEGVVGMQVGGRRELIIPPNLAYGDQSPGSGIAANDTLIFIVDLVKIN
jgi:peptidylprolyl isomerase